MARTPQKWRTQIYRSLEFQKKRRDEVARFKRGYTGDYSIEPRKKLDENKDQVSVNFIYTYIETVRPTIVPGTPKAFVEGLDAQSQAAENHYQAVINNYIRTLGLKTDLKKNVDDWFYSWAAFLTEWDYHEEPRLDENGETTFEADEMGQPVLDEDGQPQQAFQVVRDQPLAKRLDPWDVILDPDSKTRKEDHWRGYRIIETYSAFKKRPGVTKAMLKQIRPRQMPRDLMRQPMDEDRNFSTERIWVVLWRLYDSENNMIYLLPDMEGADFFIEEKEWPYEFEVGGDRFPITILEGKEDSENPYGFSVFKAVWDQVQERNRLRTMLQSNVRRNAPGWLGKKGVMDEEQKQKFVNSKIGEYNETNGDPSQIISKPLPILNPGFFAWDKTVGDDLNTVSSLNEFAAGDALADTATEASIMDQKASVRKGEAKSDFAEYAAVIFSKIGQLAQQFLTVPMAVKIRQPQNPDELSWLDVTGEHIQGEFHLWVEPGDDAKKTESLYRQQTLKGAELLSNNPWCDQKKLAVKLAKCFDWESVDILKTDQQFQQEAQMQQQMKQAEIDAKKKPVRPDIEFAAIKLELLPPEIQALVIAAAIKENGATPPPSAIPGSAPGLPPPGTGGVAPPGAGSPSMAGPGASNSVMPGAGMNQAPPANGSAAMPPHTPVMPASEMQGGHT